jgi:hypothetical protein
MMRKLVLGLFLMGLAVSSVLGASVPGEKPIQFSLALSGGGFWPDSGDARTIIGLGTRLDFNLGKWIILAPEVTLGLAGTTLTGTFNLRYNGLFAGAGGGLVYFWEDQQEVGAVAVVKLQAGFKSRNWIVTAAYMSDSLPTGWFYGFQGTIGYIF